MTHLSDQLAERYKQPKECEIQKGLFQWANYYTNDGYKLSDYMIAIPNGGSRHMIEAKNLKAQGVKPGVSDIFLAMPKGNKSGLWIELKRDKTCKLSTAQKEWLEKMKSMGYAGVVCYGLDEAIKAIEDYLDGDK